MRLWTARNNYPFAPGMCFLQIVIWFCRVLSNYLTTPFSLQPRHVSFGFGTHEEYPPAFSVLLCLTKHQLWVSRNKYVFSHMTVDEGRCHSKIKSSFRFHLRMQQSSSGTDAFYNEWLGSGICGVISADNAFIFADSIAD